MASRRSRRMQRGGGDTQDRLATLGAMRQLMGDPLKDLGGLLSLQKIMQDMEQSAADEARATRSEDFAKQQHRDMLDHQARERHAQRNRDIANYRVAQRRNELLASGNELQRLDADRNYQLALQKARNEQEELDALREERLGPELVRMLKVGQGLAAAGVLPNSEIGKNYLLELGQTLLENKVLPEELNLTPESVGPPPPGSSNEKDALNSPSPYESGGSMGGWSG